jgi:hypothetical protein
LRVLIRASLPVRHFTVRRNACGVPELGTRC